MIVRLHGIKITYNLINNRFRFAHILFTDVYRSTLFWLTHIAWTRSSAITINKLMDRSTIAANVIPIAIVIVIVRIVLRAAARVIAQMYVSM